MSPRRDVSMTPDEVAEFLSAPRTAVLSTLGPDGGPHSAGMWFVFDGESVAMWTYAKSQKARNAVRDPRCAFLVEDGMAYNELRGVLITGKLSVLTAYDDVFAIGKRLYDRYTLPATGVAAEEGPEIEIVRQAHKRVGLVLKATRVASWDHRRL